MAPFTETQCAMMTRPAVGWSGAVKADITPRNRSLSFESSLLRNVRFEQKHRSEKRDERKQYGETCVSCLAALTPHDAGTASRHSR